ncbi:MAG: hypothetical protein AAF916_11900 [Planctomycetota bacterium]
MRTGWLVMWTAGVGLIAGTAGAFTDDFTDGVPASAWTVLQDDPATLSLNEQGGRLDVLASNPPNNAIDALYLSNGVDGFRVGTTQDFELTLRYSLSGFDDNAAVVGDALGLTFGVGRDLDGQDSAAIGYGVGRQALGPFVATSTALAAGVRINDVQSESILAIGSPDGGTFRITYDAAGDDLSLGLAGGSAFLLEDTVRGVWGAEALFVSFGARGGGFSWGLGDAWLDDFAVVNGDVRPLNPASALAGDFNASGAVEQSDLDLALTNWGGLRGFEDGASVFASSAIDQEELDAVLLNWGAAAAGRVANPNRAIPEPTLNLALAAGCWGLICTRRRPG